MHKIPLCIPSIEENEKKAVLDVLNSGWLTHGPKNKEFEKSFADFIGVKHAISMNSCTSALFISLVANNIRGEVILPSFSFTASANAIVTAGAIPVFADINKEDRNLDPECVESLITKNTEAIMVVHYGGQCANMDKFMEIAERYNLLLIEDSAETIGGEFDGKIGGSFGIGNFSFFPTKNITVGEGGMLTTNDDNLAEKIRTLIAHGINNKVFLAEKEKKPWFRSASEFGYNFRLSNILAAIGIEQMLKIEKLNQKRRENSHYLNKYLSEISEIEIPQELLSRKHVYQMYTILLNPSINRDKFVIDLNNFGIGASVHFDPPIHQQEFYKKNYKFSHTLQITEEVSSRIVTLPMYPDLKKEELDFIIGSIRKIMGYS